ncbi:5-oxoprolinase subunit PxpA [Botrimarina hoheduenensis]|uniref:LamB/YcsF family protein n=1 Tax=Botrimarina hoheduenensis TaxID=2528000 RepID=A0A5C5VXQ0_9BACT|nr:5-oxoprolinase subunit PxpA [Botrimarina hoheduenensis]TWT43214.1 LamB/YcsF family protein [Botrimarina hoheduenensis]
MPTIDLNADVGEGFDVEGALIPLVTSASIACGGHAGDPQTMRRSVAIAREHGVAIGAHPGHADPEHFGRRALDLDEQHAHRLVLVQTRRLVTIASELGTRVRYVKLHGALYHQANHHDTIARGVVSAVALLPGPPALLGPAGTRLHHFAIKAGLAYFLEAFADRVYEEDGSLRSRAEKGAVLSSAALVRQALSLATNHGIVTPLGNSVPIACDSLCLHGDTPDAVENARAVREAFATARIAVQPFTA